MKVTCTCGAILKVPDDSAGKKLRCPQCSVILRVPEGDNQEGPSAPVGAQNATPAAGQHQVPPAPPPLPPTTPRTPPQEPPEPDPKASDPGPGESPSSDGRSRAVAPEVFDGSQAGIPKGSPNSTGHSGFAGTTRRYRLTLGVLCVAMLATGFGLRLLMELSSAGPGEPPTASTGSGLAPAPSTCNCPLAPAAPCVAVDPAPPVVVPQVAQGAEGLRGVLVKSAAQQPGSAEGPRKAKEPTEARKLTEAARPAKTTEDPLVRLCKEIQYPKQAVKDFSVVSVKRDYNTCILVVQVNRAVSIDEYIFTYYDKDDVQLGEDSQFLSDVKPGDKIKWDIRPEDGASKIIVKMDEY